MSKTDRRSYTPHLTWEGKNAFHHGYRDNQIYFITARCRGRFLAFESEAAKDVFWNRFDHYTGEYDFTPVVTTLLNNHHHTLGDLKIGNNLGPMMQRNHGSVAKLVNDLLERERQSRLVPFRHDKRHHDYFDGCLRDETQFRLTFRYVRGQSVRHRVSRDWKDDLHTRVRVACERALSCVTELKVLLWGVKYRRHEERQGR